VTADGVLIVASRANRSQAENRRAARARLVVLLKRAAEAPKPRRATKPASAVRGERRTSKQRHSALKRSRSGRDEG
jgi:ribosome-associated protein